MSNNPAYNRRWYKANKERLAAIKADRQKNDLDYRLHDGGCLDVQGFRPPPKGYGGSELNEI